MTTVRLWGGEVNLTGFYVSGIVALIMCGLKLTVFDHWTWWRVLLPLAIFVGLLPLTLSGMGTRDPAFIALFGGLGVAAEVSLGVGLLYSLYGYWLPALVGLPFMRRVLGR